MSPGREAEGYLQLPGGQSGHPLSPFYRAGHAAWARGHDDDAVADFYAGSGGRGTWNKCFNVRTQIMECRDKEG